METNNRPHVVIEQSGTVPPNAAAEKTPQEAQNMANGSPAARSPQSIRRAKGTKRQGEKQNATKQKRKLTDKWPVMMLEAELLMNVFSLLGAWVLLLDEDSDFWYTFAEYFIFCGVWIGFLLFLRFSKKNRPILSCLWTKPKGNNLKLFAIGLGIGFGMNGLCILLAWLHGDIHMFWRGASPLGLLVILFAVFVQSSAEELVCRGFLYQRLRRSYSRPWVAVVCSSALFAATHLLNDGVTALAIADLFVTGVLFSLMVYYLDSIWCAMAAHTAWNFTQNIIFGLPNSGMGAPFSILKLDAATATGSFFYDVGFGVEGRVPAILIQLVVLAAIVLWARKHRAGKQPYNPWTAGLAQPNGISSAASAEVSDGSVN